MLNKHTHMWQMLQFLSVITSVAHEAAGTDQFQVRSQSVSLCVWLNPLDCWLLFPCSSKCECVCACSKNQKPYPAAAAVQHSSIHWNGTESESGEAGWRGCTRHTVSQSVCRAALLVANSVTRLAPLTTTSINSRNCCHCHPQTLLSSGLPLPLVSQCVCPLSRRVLHAWPLSSSSLSPSLFPLCSDMFGHAN